MTKITSTIKVQNKKYEYTIEPVKRSSKVVRFLCDAAKIDQEFLSEDIGQLLIDLPNLIIAEKEYKKTQSEVVRFRISTEDKKIIEEKAIAKGFESVSDYLRACALA